jgi:hypothetical protein
VTEQTQAGAGEGQSTQAQQSTEGQQQGAQQAQAGQQAAQQQAGQQQAQQAQGAQQAQQARFPDNWRELMAGDDAAELKRLARFTSPDAAFKSFREMEKRFSAAKFKTELPADATEEQITQYRRDNGIPETPDKYELKLEDGLVVGEDDKPMIDLFLKAMHAKHASPEIVSAAVNAYYQIQEEQQAAQIEEARALKEAAQETLRAEWGADYKTNVNLMKATLASMPESLRDRFKSATLGDGSFAFNDVEFCQWFAGWAREINPAGTVVGGGADNQLQTIDAELAKMAEQRKKNINAWQKPENAATRARERELLDAKAKIKARAA